MAYHGVYHCANEDDTNGETRSGCPYTLDVLFSGGSGPWSRIGVREGASAGGEKASLMALLEG